MNTILFAITSFFSRGGWLQKILKSKWFYYIILIILLIFIVKYSINKIDTYYKDKYQLQIDKNSQEYKNNLTKLNNDIVDLKNQLSTERNRLSFLLDKEVAEYVQIMDNETYKDRDLHNNILTKYGVPDAWLYIKTDCREGDSNSSGTNIDTRPSCNDSAYIAGKIIETRYATILAKLVGDLANEAKRADEVRGKFNALVKINNAQRLTLDAYNKKLMELRETTKEAVQKYNQISALPLYTK